MFSTKLSRSLPVGAEVSADGTTHFRVWASARKRVQCVLESEGRSIELAPEPNNYFSGKAENAPAGTLYRFRVDGGDLLLPDPASRFQPDGPHGPSMVVDWRNFRWSDKDWRGVKIEGQVIYEMHLGTFTREGTWRAAQRELNELRDAGITVLEIMPVADFPGKFGWGYDGVDTFAPSRLYGTPDDMRTFINEAHKIGMGVILDVVYNHFGPDGNYVREFSEQYFTDKYDNEWGDAINFDGGPGCEPVREFFITNARYWIEEFHLDGLRLDATQQIFDNSSPHILAEISEAARKAAGKRSIILVAENEPQHTNTVRPVSSGGFGLDALWNDDFHHSAVVALTGHNDAYYTDTLGTSQEFISAIKYGYLYQGQWYSWQKNPRGTPAFDLAPAQFVLCIENHDQVANWGQGQRITNMTSPGRLRAITALLLLAPGTPMLFQGQEFGASSPFVYFANHDPKLGDLVSKGRKEFMTQFRALATPEMAHCFRDPNHEETFRDCKLDFSEREKNAEIYALHKDLLRLRREDAVFRAQKPRSVDGAVLGEHAFVLRFFGERGDDRLLLVNLGRDLRLREVPEPLLAPPMAQTWEIGWSSEHPSYCGGGTAEIETKEGWRIPGEAAVVLIPKKVE